MLESWRLVTELLITYHLETSYGMFDVYLFAWTPAFCQ